MSAMLLRGRAHGDARRHLDVLMGELASCRSDCSTLPILALGEPSRACSSRDGRRAARLHALLEPYEGQFVNTGGSWFGAVAHHLAMHATRLLGPAARGGRAFAAAERAYEELGAEAWLARCRLDWAGALVARGGRGPRAGAGALLERCWPARARSSCRGSRRARRRCAGARWCGERRRSARAFAALHVPGSPLLMPNPWDAGSARLLASLGFEALRRRAAASR